MSGRISCGLPLLALLLVAGRMITVDAQLAQRAFRSAR